MNWINTNDRLPQLRGEYIVFFKEYDDDDFIQGYLPFIPGKVADSVLTDETNNNNYPHEYEYVLDMENVFLTIEEGQDGDWWYIPVAMASHWIPKPENPNEYSRNIVDTGEVLTGSFIKKWTDYHRHRVTPYQKVAESLYNEVWSKNAQAAGFFPLGYNSPYNVISVKGGTKVIVKKAG